MRLFCCRKHCVRVTDCGIGVAREACCAELVYVYTSLPNLAMLGWVGRKSSKLGSINSTSLYHFHFFMTTVSHSRSLFATVHGSLRSAWSMRASRLAKCAGIEASVSRPPSNVIIRRQRGNEMRKRR